MKSIFIYILMFASLWLMGAILIRNGRTAFSFCFGVLMLVAGCSSFAFSINLTIIPFIEKYYVLPLSVKQTLIWISIAAAYAYWYFLNGVGLVSSILFGSWIPRKHWLPVFSLLALLPALLLVIDVATDSATILNISLIRYVAGMYLLATCLLYILHSRREKNRLLQRSHVRTTFVSVTALLWAYMMDFAGMSRLTFSTDGFIVESNGLWEFNYLIILWIVLFFIYFGGKYGIWGIKLRFERQKYDYSMKTLTLGTSILNHSIKNELSKINYLNERAKGNIRENKDEAAIEQLDIIDDVARHMLGMIERIKEKADDILLVEKTHELAPLIEYTVQTLKPVFDSKRMTIRLRNEADGYLICDADHVKEVLNNLCLNAADAMEEGRGELLIETKTLKKALLIEIKDNGSGISPEHVKKIFDPFFTTKKMSNRFGLGLSYCYGVMQKHGGEIQITETEQGKGTTFLLQFPAKKFRSIKKPA
ncbi:sensor histidine kinase [Paenibacillus sp. MBLB4367]|uniref:sensor histidine kinase n=1 Tax=Paenibacillus sp. MBLB4367 TaxID=3384767 RepID=UPI003907FA18